MSLAKFRKTPVINPSCVYNGLEIYTFKNTLERVSDI